MDLLATQPDELKGIIISQSREMLDLRVTIKQREKSHARFEKPSTDATTGSVLNDKDGNPLPFIPISLRSKCPIKASNAMNDEPLMAVLLEKAKQAHAEHISKMTSYAQQASRMEISLRTRQLRHKMYNLQETIALSRLIILEFSGGMPPTGMKLNRDELVTKITFDILANSAQGIADAVGKDNGAELAEEFAKHKSFDNPAMENKMEELDKRIMQPIITLMNTWLPRLSVDLWKEDDEKDKQRDINAALRIAFKPKAMQTATEAVEAAMDVEDVNNPSKSLIEVIRKEQKKLADKQMVQLKRQMRKNYSGGEKDDLPPKPTENGRERKKSSKNPMKDQKGSSKKKKKKDAANEPEKSNPRTKKKATKKNASKAGSQAGSSGGGKRKGAARR